MPDTGRLLWTADSALGGHRAGRVIRPANAALAGRSGENFMLFIRLMRAC